MSSSPAQAEDFFSALQRAFGGGAPATQETPTVRLREGRRAGHRGERARAEARRTVQHEREPVHEPKPRAVREVMPRAVRGAALPAKPIRRVQLAALVAPPVKVPLPLDGGTDLSGAVDSALVAGERKAYADTLAGKAPAAWLYGRQTMCVRLCDGYAYPVGVLTKPGDLAVHATACRATCPGAITALFARPNGSEGMESALSVGGRPYATLRTAFAYRQKMVPSCSCQNADAPAYTPLPLSQDRTLRPGDIVIGKVNAFVLLAGQVPKLENVLHTKALTKATRQQIASIIGYQTPHISVRVQLSAPEGDGAPVLQVPSADPAVRVVLPNLY